MNMTKAEILKREILRQYRSVRQFAIEMNIPYSTLVTALERIGSDKVHIRPLSDEEGMQTPDTRRWETFSDTVASLRLDGIVAAAVNLSRDKAKQLVSGGFVDVDFRPCDAPDTELTAGTYLSIRGHGRYLFSDVDGTSKKGRIRIRIKKLI